MHDRSELVRVSQNRVKVISDIQISIWGLHIVVNGALPAFAKWSTFSPISAKFVVFFYIILYC